MSEWRVWMHKAPRAMLSPDAMIEMTREPEVAGGRRWAQRVGDVQLSNHVVGLYWRVPPPEAQAALTQVDALGAALRAGEMYLSSPLGLVPVTVEGVRLLVDALVEAKARVAKR